MQATSLLAGYWHLTRMLSDLYPDLWNNYDETKEKKKTCSRGYLTVLVACKEALQRKPKEEGVGES